MKDIGETIGRVYFWVIFVPLYVFALAALVLLPLFR